MTDASEKPVYIVVSESWSPAALALLKRLAGQGRTASEISYELTIALHIYRSAAEIRRTGKDLSLIHI